MISILFPSRSRSLRAKVTAEKWLANAGCDVELIVSLDSDDPDPYNNMPGKIVRGQNRSAVDAINRAAKVSSGQILIQIAEDFNCPEMWGAKIVDFTQGKTDWILKTQDGIQDWIITLPIMDRAYYNRFGYVYYPEYLHMFCDTEMSCVADLTGKRITSTLMFPHNHYSVTKEPKDQISAKADSTWNQGEKLFIERYKKNFDLLNPTGEITNQGYLNWIRTKC